MLNYLKKITSLKNMRAAKPEGQIATLLMLAMVVVLIFVLITVNLGKLSITSTRVSNAADAAALQLGSKMASYSHSMGESLKLEPGETEKCKRGGLLGVVVAAIKAVIEVVMIIASGGTLTPLVVLMIMADAAMAGALTMGIATGSWSGALRGAIQGAIVGGAIAGGFMAFAGVPAAGASYTTSALIAGSIGAAIGAASTIYTAAARDAAASEAMADNIRQITDEYAQAREDIFYAALSQTVDDPHKVKDIYDLNGNGDTDDLVPAFENWYFERLRTLHGTNFQDPIRDFRDNVLKLFKNSALGFLDQIARQEVECNSCGSSEGPLIELFRGVERCSDLSFWDPGPSRNALYCASCNPPAGTGWYIDNCASCDPPTGWDSVDYTHVEYEDFIDTITGILNSDIRDLDANRDWINLLYSETRSLETDEESEAGKTDLYGRLGIILYGGSPPGTTGKPVIGMQTWVPTLKERANSLPKCQLVYGNYNQETNVPLAPPCNDHYDPTSDAPQFYPCPWQKESNPRTGPNFPNPPCQVGPFHKQAIIEQLTTISTFVNGLERLILTEENLASLAFCNAGDSLYGSPTVTINITSIALSGSQKNPCSEAAVPEATITYNFNYTVSWTCQHPYPCNCPCTGTPPNQICPGPICYSTCYSYYSPPPLTGSRTRTKPLPGVTDVVSIPSTNESTFLTWVSEMSAMVAGLTTTPKTPFATIDNDTANEFTEPLQTLTNQVPMITSTRDAIRQFAGNMKDFEANPVNVRLPNGGGDVTYPWKVPDKDEGPYEYSVKVETGPFIFPKLTTKKTGNWLLNKTCTKVENGCANTGGCTYSNSNHNDIYYVRITREEPANIPLKPGGVTLGKWNPFSGSSNKITITKTSRPYYDANSVGIARKD